MEKKLVKVQVFFSGNLNNKNFKGNDTLDNVPESVLKAWDKSKLRYKILDNVPVKPNAKV